MIPQAFIQDLLARVDVVDVVGRHVKLRKSGANYLGLCPFHGEKTPSFTVSPDKQFYHCFGCGAHGSAVGFLMEHAGLGYVEAIEELAHSIGLEVPREGGTSGAREQAQKTAVLFDLLEQAAGFYRAQLKTAPAAIEYLRGRALEGRTAARFALGYAPDAWQGLEAVIADYEGADAVRAGLVIEGRGDRRYDRFRDRIMFPIRDARGRVLGFGGRVIGAGEPKYLNSPETPLFSKGHELYGLYEARAAIRREDCALVVEGYLDVVLLAQHGIDNVVATLGTATTPEHVRKLLRLADRVVFAFDGDAAGGKAAWRALEASLAQVDDRKRIEFLFLPAGHDPDSHVRTFGADGFRQALGSALPLSEYLIRELGGRVDLTVPEGRARLLAEAGALLHTLAAPALRLQLVHRLAQVCEIPADELQRYLADLAVRSRPAERGAADTPSGSVAGAGTLPGAMPSPSSRHGVTATGARFAGGAGSGLVRRAAARPDLEQKIRWLAALHPAFARRALDPVPGQEPEEALAGCASAALVEWLETIAGLEPDASLAGVCEALRRQAPTLVGQLEREAAAADWVPRSLSDDEAWSEFEAALAQLRDRSLARRMNEIVSAGMKTPEDRERYQRLMAKRQRN